MSLWQLLLDLEAPSFALRVALGGVAVSAVVLVAERLLRRRSEPLRYGVLFAGVIGLLAVPLLVALGQRFQDAVVTAAPEEVEVVKVPAEALHEFLNRPAEDVPAEAESTASPGQAILAGLLALWALGMLLGWMRLLFGLWKQGRALVSTPWAPAFWTDELRGQLARKLGLGKFPPVRVSPAAPMPMVIGIWRPTIFLPEKAPASWQQPQWEAVLLHEAAHIARRDPWAALVQHLAVVLFWWCPLVHLMGRRLNELRESICDDCALQGPCDHIAYAELLVDSAERFLDLKPIPVPLGLLDSARGGLEARVLRLLQKERKPMIKLSFAGKLLGAGLLVAACIMTTAATSFSQAQAQPHKKIQIKILVDGKEIDLSDLEIWEHVEAAQKKAAEKPGDVIKIKIDKRPEVVELGPHLRAIVGGGEKNVAFSPDGKMIVTSDGKTITVFDAATGKIIAKHAAGAAGHRDVLMHWVQQGGQAKTDPRIEELVKQAEKIKPGSGAEIRRALEGKKMTALVAPAAVDYYRALTTAAKPHLPNVQVIEADGKKIIILSIDDGKVQQLDEKDLRKMIEKGLRIHVDIDAAKKTEEKKIIEKKGKETRGPNFEFEFKTPIFPSPSKDAKKPAAPVADLDALSRQLERINAELRELRERLNAQKK